MKQVWTDGENETFQHFKGDILGGISEAVTAVATKLLQGVCFCHLYLEEELQSHR